MRPICSGAIEPFTSRGSVLVCGGSLTVRDEPGHRVEATVVSLGESAGQLDSLRFAVDHLTHGLLETVVDLCNNLKTLSMGPSYQGAIHPDTYIQVG
jgi:hypothetical protein